MLKISNLEAGYGKIKVLRGVSLEIEEGEIISLIGANGARGGDAAVVSASHTSP